MWLELLIKKYLIISLLALGTITPLHHDKLDGFVANEHINWITDQEATNIHNNNLANSGNWDTAYTHSQVAGGNSVHVSTTENTNWDAAFTHVSNNGSDHSFIDQAVTIAGTPTHGGLTITGNSVFGLNSSVFQSTTDSTTFFQVLDADDGAPVFNVDTTNERVGIGTANQNRKLEVSTATSVSQDILRLSESGSPTNNYLEMGSAIIEMSRANNSSIGLDIKTVNQGSWSALVETAGAIELRPNEVFVLTATRGERVGIRTRTPRSILEVFGGASRYLQLVGLGEGQAFMDIKCDFDTNPVFRINGVGDSTLFVMQDDGTDVFNVLDGGNVGFREFFPETLTEWTHATPSMTWHCSTHTNLNEARKTIFNFKGEQSGGEETTLARIEVGHDGTSDDEKGYKDWFINTGSDGDSPTFAMRLNSVGLGVRTSTQVSLLEADGALGLAIETVTGNTTLDNTHSTLLVNASGNVTITLPTAASAYNSTDGIGRIYTVKKIDADADLVTVDPDGNEEIEFAPTAVLTVQGESIIIQTDGSNWYIL